MWAEPPVKTNAGSVQIMKIKFTKQKLAKWRSVNKGLEIKKQKNMNSESNCSSIRCSYIIIYIGKNIKIYERKGIFFFTRYTIKILIIIPASIKI